MERRGLKVLEGLTRRHELPQQDRQRLLVGDFSARLEFGERATADRVLHGEEGIVGQAKHARDVARRDFERRSAQHHRALAQLLESYSVVQTAR